MLPLNASALYDRNHSPSSGPRSRAQNIGSASSSITVWQLESLLSPHTCCLQGKFQIRPSVATKQNKYEVPNRTEQCTDKWMGNHGLPKPEEKKERKKGGEAIFSKGAGSWNKRCPRTGTTVGWLTYRFQPSLVIIVWWMWKLNKKPPPQQNVLSVRPQIMAPCKSQRIVRERRYSRINDTCHKHRLTVDSCST